MESRNLPNKRVAGLSLVELMVAMAILVFGAVAGLAILLQAQKSNNLSRAKTIATNAAEERMEAIFSDFPSNVTTYDNFTFPVADLVGAGGGAPGLITVSADEPRVVTVSVVWQGQGTLPTGQVILTALRSEATR
ncbi:MAG: prepilin-type N-terminal cleavage/methylation domain-containing protein [Candidatus Hydrogenedentota bacterium]|nr:MAG: prepilin-type N-terminal cleavage/methylation domain-containing protein [Candidatus Hydrogenedentota bacterium]